MGHFKDFLPESMAEEGVHLFLGYDGLSMILNALLLFLDDQGVFCVLLCMLHISFTYLFSWVLRDVHLRHPTHRPTEQNNGCNYYSVFITRLINCSLK
jgi:hypothetical protein